MVSKDGRKRADTTFSRGSNGERSFVAPKNGFCSRDLSTSGRVVCVFEQKKGAEETLDAFLIRLQRTKAIRLSCQQPERQPERQQQAWQPERQQQA